MSENSEKDYLNNDAPITNQTWACVSFITPELVKGCDKRFLKVRGVYGVKERAEDRAKELSVIDSTFGVYVVEVGKWIAWLDGKDNKADANDELNKLMKLYKKERVQANINYEKRKEQLKSSKKEEDVKEIMIKDFKDSKVEEQIVEEKIVDEEKLEGTEIKYLKEDDVIGNQKYYCVSFLTPEQMENPTDLKVRGFKIRGMYETEDSAKEQCKNLRDVDQYNNIFIADIGHLVSWSNDTNNASDVDYANKDLNNLIKASNENQKKAREFSESQNTEVNEVNEVDLISESFEEDLNLSAIEESSNEEEIEDINDELENAKKLYKKMLNEQKKKN